MVCDSVVTDEEEEKDDDDGVRLELVGQAWAWPGDKHAPTGESIDFGDLPHGADLMQPRDPCRPWRGTLASGHKPR